MATGVGGVVNWRRIRDRFGIAAPRVAVRTHLPWHWRALGTGLLLALSVACGAWLYDVAVRATGSRYGHTQEEIDALMKRVDELGRDLAAARSAGNVNSALQIERTTREELARQVRTLEAENIRLKEDVALFEKLAATDGSAAGITVTGLQVESDAVPGQYRYRFLAALQGAKKDRDFKGSLQVIVALQQAGKRVMMVLPAPHDPDRQRYSLSIRHYRRVDGTFQIPDGARALSVEVRLQQDGATKASQSINL